MIARLRGPILEKSPGRVVLECAGVGYEAAVSIPTFAALPESGHEVSLHIHTHVREDQLALYGFSSLDEKRLFEKLLSISGVGPKLALTILSGLEPERLIAAIRSGDHATLTRIPGVGKKTAERVTLELKDKLQALAAGAPITPLPGTAGAVAEDVLSALENLGYPRIAAEKALAKVLAEHPTDSKDAELPDFEILFRAAVAAVR
jgi:holliday junction DNA helicase RuvA